MDDFKPLIYRILIGFVALIVVFVSFAFIWSCGLDFSCKKAQPPVVGTPIPTLAAAHISSAPKTDAAEFNKCQVRAVDLIGAWVDADAPQTDSFEFTDMNGVLCQGAFEADIMPLFNESQVWYRGSLSCTSCHNSALDSKRSGGLDMSTYAAILMGSGRESVEAQGASILSGGWKGSKLFLAFNAEGDALVVGHPTLAQANALIVYAGSPVPPPTATPLP